ncbi:MAG: hypothetical protein ACPK7O_10530 [Methanobacterium sp.]
MHNKYTIIVIGLLTFVILNSGCTSNDLDNQIGVNSTGGSFENQWIKFNYPSNLTITDNSTNDDILITIYNGNEYIGSIYNQMDNINNYVPFPESYNTTIGGRKALREYDMKTLYNGENQIRPSAAIYLTQNATLNVIFEPTAKKPFNQVIKTLIIKKDNVTKDRLVYASIFDEIIDKLFRVNQ